MHQRCSKKGIRLSSEHGIACNPINVAPKRASGCHLTMEVHAGTSDEHISVVQYLKTSHVDGAVIVTTPQEVSIIDVRKEINFCKKVVPDLETPFCNPSSV